MKELLGVGEAASAQIEEVNSDRRRVDPKGILIAARAGLSLYWCKMVLNPHSRLQSINGLYQGEVHEPAEGPT